MRTLNPERFGVILSQQGDFDITLLWNSWKFNSFPSVPLPSCGQNIISMLPEIRQVSTLLKNPLLLVKENMNHHNLSCISLALVLYKDAVLRPVWTGYGLTTETRIWTNLLWQWCGFSHVALTIPHDTGSSRKQAQTAIKCRTGFPLVQLANKNEIVSYFVQLEAAPKSPYKVCCQYWDKSNTGCAETRSWQKTPLVTQRD